MSLHRHRLTGLVLLLAAALSGCGETAAPHDAAKAKYGLDVLPRVSWIYQDENLPVCANLDCWNSEGTGRMHYTEGQYSIGYTLQPETGPAIVVPDEPYGPLGPAGTVQRSPSLDLVKVLGRAPAAGDYKLTVAVRLPSGQTIQGGVFRDVAIRARELRVSLTSDKERYAVGEPIVLTGSLENLSDKDIDLEGLKVALRDSETGSSCNPLAESPADTPTLDAGRQCQLFRVTFKAGETDARFNSTSGPLRGNNEFQLPPFKRLGKYMMEYEVKMRTSQTTTPVTESYIRPWMESLPASTAFEIVP
jgi:hypothetical protein